MRSFLRFVVALFSLVSVTASLLAAQSPWFENGSPNGPADISYWEQLDRIPSIVRDDGGGGAGYTVMPFGNSGDNSVLVLC